MLEWRLKAYRHWLTMTEPNWQNAHYPPIDYQASIYYAAPKPKKTLNSLDEVDPEVAEDLRKAWHFPQRTKAPDRRGRGCGRGQRFGRHDVSKRPRQTRHHFLLVQRGGAEASRTGREISRHRRAVHGQFFRRAELPPSSATARSVTSPKACAARWNCPPISASTPPNTGQFERTLIIAEEGAYVSYLEGCTAPMRDENQLHAAVVELIALGTNPRSNIPPCKTGIPATRTARAASTIS